MILVHAADNGGVAVPRRVSYSDLCSLHQLSRRRSQQLRRAAVEVRSGNCAVTGVRTQVGSDAVTLVSCGGFPNAIEIAWQSAKLTSVEVVAAEEVASSSIGGRAICSCLGARAAARVARARERCKSISPSGGRLAATDGSNQ